MFIMKADAAHPGKFDFTYNVREVLQRTVPEGKGWYIENQAEKPIEGGENALWRKGAFEVLRLDTNELLYSKMATGEHLVDGKGGPEGKLGTFVDDVLAVANHRASEPTRRPAVDRSLRLRASRSNPSPVVDRRTRHG